MMLPKKFNEIRPGKCEDERKKQVDFLNEMQYHLASFYLNFEPVVIPFVIFFILCSSVRCNLFEAFIHYFPNSKLFYTRFFHDGSIVCLYQYNLIFFFRNQGRLDKLPISFTISLFSVFFHRKKDSEKSSTNRSYSGYRWHHIIILRQ